MTRRATTRFGQRPECRFGSFTATGRGIVYRSPQEIERLPQNWHLDYVPFYAEDT